MGIGRKKIQTKGIDDLFNYILPEKFPKFEKGRAIQVQETNTTPNCQDKKRNNHRHIIIKHTMYRTKKEN
jgi:hypothetical protein